MLNAGRLRHKIQIQELTNVEDTSGAVQNDVGELQQVWTTIATVWAEIAPLSAREMIAAQKENSEVVAKIIIRYRANINAAMRLYHAAKNNFYNIEGILSDKESGLEYLTIPVSQGMKYQTGGPDQSKPFNLSRPVITGNAIDGFILASSTGTWANSPDDYSYTWFADGVEISGEDLETLIVDGITVGTIITVEVTATNAAGDSEPVTSDGVEVIAAPQFTSSFSDVVQNSNKMFDFLFGTAATPAPDQIAIKNVAELAEFWEPFSYNAGQYIINKENQRYRPFSSSENFNFSNNSLDLTATLHGGTLPRGISTASPTENQVYGRVVKIADTTNIKTGQIVGLGAEQYANFHKIATYHINGTIGNGDTVSMAFLAKDDAFSPVTKTVTASGVSTASTLAAALVAAINADTVLSANKITAYILPNSPGCYGVSSPKNSIYAEDEFGDTAKGSIWNIGYTNSKTGTVNNDLRSIVTLNYVVSKTSDSITLAHPVSVTTSSVLTFSPARAFTLASTILPGTVIDVEDASGVQIGEVLQVGYQDNNLIPITAVGPTSFTIEKNLYAGAGLIVVVLPIFTKNTNAVTSNSNVLHFASVPDGVEADQVFFNYFAEGNSGLIKVVSKTSTSVTLDTAVTVGSGDTVYFLPPIYSGQIWSKFIVRPDDDQRVMIAMELTCDIPNAANIAAWPAFWMFSDTTDPEPGPGSGVSEIDMLDLFTYFNNGSTGDYTAASSSPKTDLYNHPAFQGGKLNGNNAGLKERKVQIVWTATKVYFYLDGTLINARSFTWNAHFRAQVGINLAVGSVNQSFNSNGFFPIDCSQFPMKFKLKRLRIWQSPGNEEPYQHA